MFLVFNLLFFSEGVSHADELHYLFRYGLVHPSNDEEVQNLILTLWTNFMKFG